MELQNVSNTIKDLLSQIEDNNDLLTNSKYDKLIELQNLSQNVKNHIINHQLNGDKLFELTDEKINE